jgi:ketosteroid isomerase-like protein
MKHMRKIIIIIILLLLVLQTGCSAAPTKQVLGPEGVLRAITDALNAKDAETATSYLADDVTQALIPAPSGTGIYKGKEAMHARFKEVVAGNPTHRLSNCQTNGESVTCDATFSDDSTKPLGFALEFKVDAVVHNGLLKAVTWKLTDASLAKMQAAMAKPAPTK